MSLNPDIRDQAYQFFIEEAQELLVVLETGLLELREDHSTPKVHELMRAAHSIKGGAASVELGTIELLAHRLEDFFKALYSDEVDFDEELEGLLLQGYDCLRNPLSAQIESGDFDQEEALLAAEPVFACLEFRLEDALKNSDNYIPSSNDLGVDIVSSIFEVDVVQALEALQEMVANPSSYNLAAEFQEKLDMFAGFAELFNLPGFNEIVQTAQTALGQNPGRLTDIIQLTIADCTLAKDQVLAGDRDQGGQASAALRDLAQLSRTPIKDEIVSESDLVESDQIEVDQASQVGEDMLWSSEPVTDPFAADIFGIALDSDAEVNPAIAAESTWESAQLTDANIDNIFGTMPDVAIESTPSDGENIFDSIPQVDAAREEVAAEVLESDNSELDDIFGVALDSDGEVTPEIAAESTGESAQFADADIDNIFGTMPDSQTDNQVEPVTDLKTTESATVLDLAANTDDAIEDVFGNILESEAMTAANLESVELTDSSIDNIFAEIPEEQTTDAIASENLISKNPVSENLESVALENENAESALASIEDIFGAALPEDTATTEIAADSEELTSAEAYGANTLETDTVGSDPESVTVENDTSVSEDLAAENIETAVESIESLFESLPSVAKVPDSLALPTKAQTSQESTVPVSQTGKSPAKKSASRVAQPKTAAKLSVRVDLERLERMNNLVGELTINRNSLSLQNQQLQDNVSELGQKFLRFREVTRKMREISDQMILEQRSHSLRSSRSFKTSNSPIVPVRPVTQINRSLDEATEFDALEMDSYSTLYSSLQEVLEEIVQLEESVDDITIFAKQSDRTIDSQRQMLGQMRDELMWVRMLPLEQILQRFPRTLRDLSSKYQKPVDLKMTGTGVLVDKAVLEKLSDPLLHLLRNGFDHGIEPSEIRAKSGKSPRGSIGIHAYYQGNQTVIEVKDDGKGLDLETIAQKGIDRGLISATEAASASKEQLFDLIFEPGFSTASQVSELSGRGVGMNIVRSQIETLKGKITVASEPGKGSTFTMRLPLTLTIAKLLVCSLGSTAFAIASDSIEEIVIPQSEEVKTANGQRFLAQGNKLVPIYSLPEILQYNCPVISSDSSKVFKTIAAPEDWLAPLLILRWGQQLVALEVVSLLSEQELVIKPYGKAIAAPIYTYGCTILGDGSLIPAFDGAALISTILGESVMPLATDANLASNLIGLTDGESEDSIAAAKSAEVAASKSTGNLVREVNRFSKMTALKTILIIDDSTALRRTMALTLEKQGYQVVQAKDGKDGINGFRNNPDLDLIICDVEMPIMNGFEFLGMRRRDSALSKVPTFMLTSRSGAKHRNLAKQLGADGYFTKPYIEQEFIAEIKKILEGKQNKLASTPAVPMAKQNIAQKGTVLIIDDSSALRRTLALSLENRGYRVLQGRDGLEGLEMLRANLQTKLVICDVEMPNMNGFEFLQACQAESRLVNIPVVMLSSRSNDKHQALAKSLGASKYFTKPYIEEEFMAAIGQFVKQASN